MTWLVREESGRPSSLHAELPVPDRRAVIVRRATVPAVVLGSAQRDCFDHDAVAAAGHELVRRRSGGGAVLVDEADPLWVEVTVPAGDPLWDDDVARAFLWLGRVWAEALGDLGQPASVHTGALDVPPWGRELCFAGLGPGEVCVDGRKVVGIAQRRTRAGAVFQCATHATFRPEALTSFLAVGEGFRRVATDALGRSAGTGLDRDAVLAALIARLP